jgi:3',5'-cyclic AMP phosphodiesterase CpdA
MRGMGDDGDASEQGKGKGRMLIAHVSDLHIGRDAATERAVERLAGALSTSGADAVLVSGDVTHRGGLGELARFEALFRPLLESGRVLVVPGNHDRLGDDAASAIMARRRVDTWSRPGLHVLRIDSTAPHNRRLLRSHGRVTPDDLLDVDRALAEAPAGAVVAAVLHHHLLPLPEDLLIERLAGLVGLPFTDELAAGARLLELLRGRCDLVLHGHRHRPSEVVLDATGARPLRVVNAGSTTELQRVRTLKMRAGGDGWTERWLDFAPQSQVPASWAPVGGRAAA